MRLRAAFCAKMTVFVKAGKKFGSKAETVWGYLTEKLVQLWNQQINKKHSRSLNSKAHHSKKDRPAARLSTPRRSCEKQAFGAARPQACKPGVNPCKSPCVHQSKKIRCTLLEPSSIPRFLKLPSLLNRCLQRPANNLKPHMSHISYICTCTVQYAKTYYILLFRFMPSHPPTWQNIFFLKYVDR